jgi:hypothetical protein
VFYRLSDASDAKTTLLVVLSTHLSSIEMPGIVLGDAPEAKMAFACNS